MDNLISILPALIAGFVGILAAFIAAYTSLRVSKEQFKELERRTRSENIKRYLNPLQVAAKDLKEYLGSNILKKFDDPNDPGHWQMERLKKDFSQIKDDEGNNKSGFANWCNGEGHEAVAGLYSTAAYFSHAGKIRSELPFIELQPGDHGELFNLLSNVRKSFGGAYGIWESLQDSIGSYVRRADGSVFNYREFCTEIIDWDKRIWYLRLIDFYRDFNMKKLDIEHIRDSLDELIGFLDTKGLSSSY